MINLQVIGNLGKDPELRYTPDGQAVARFSIAANRQWTDASGKKRAETTWVEVSTFGKLAEVCAEHLKKGRQVFVTGRPSVSAYKTRTGEASASLKLTATSVEFLGGAKPDEREPEPEVPFEEASF